MGRPFLFEDFMKFWMVQRRKSIHQVWEQGIIRYDVRREALDKRQYLKQHGWEARVISNEHPEFQKGSF